MANTIRLKRSSLAGKVPATSDLALGEIAVNTTDGKLYLKKSDGGEFIVEVGPVVSVAGRTGHDLPLNRVVDVTYRRRPGDLGFGSGTLLLTTVAGHLLRLNNLPRIKDMYQAVSELVADVAPRTEPEEPWR